MSDARDDKPNAFHVGSMKFEAGQVYVDDAGNKYVVSSAVSSIATCPCGDILAIQEKKCDRADCPVVAKSPSATLSPPPQPPMPAKPLWGTGWVYGNNYKQRGRPAGSGKEQGEPWYVTEDGMLWSSFDVRYRPDAPHDIYGAGQKP